MGLQDRVMDLFHRTKRTPSLSTSTVTHDRLDEGVLSDMVDRALHFRTEMYDRPHIEPEQIEGADDIPESEREKLSGDYTAWEDLFGDLFMGLHTLDGPELKDQEDLKPSRELNRRIMQQIIGSEEFAKVRPTTRHDEIASAFTALNLAPKLREQLEGELAEHVARVKQMEGNEETIENAEQQLEAIRDAVRQNGGKASPGQAAAAKNAAKQKSAARKNLAQQAATAQEQSLGQGFAEAMSEALDDAADQAEAIASLPGTEAGGDNKLPPNEAIELAQKMRDNWQVLEMMKMLGRMQRDIRYKRANRVVGGVEEIVDVKQGNELHLLLPHEKVKLMHPLLRKDFMRRYFERDLMQYETQGQAEAGRGPVITCFDGSGSMGGMPNIWARTVALSLIINAKREKRDSAAIEFSSSSDQMRWDFFAKEPIHPAKILDMASHFYGGGTDITEGVRLAQELCLTVPQFKTADIVLIGDGEDYFQEDDEKLRDELRAMGVRIHGVAIGMEAEANGFFQQMCDTVVSAWDLAGTNEATDHLAEVIS